MPRVAARRGSAVVICLSAVLVAAGCSATGTPSPASTEAAATSPTPASPTPTRSRAPEADYGANMLRCIRELGWTATLVDGLISVEATSGDPQLDADIATCEAGYGYDLPAPPMTPAEARELLAALDASARCLTAAGYPVPARPGDEEFVEGATSDPPEYRWKAYGDIPADQLVEAQTLCPLDD